MDITEKQIDGAWLVAASGRIDSNSAPALEAVLPERVQQHAATIMDLSSVAYVSSAGLRVFLKGVKAAKASGHKLVLTGLSPSVYEVFEISGFTAIFTIADDIDAGLAAIG
ncbi:MAG: STAS domain-containing protein [Sphingopyxis sp.]|uniref:STAS domain-containing protein n=1 Tax=Sphingopyxis sp. TaxID=1908224 RepID=UPI002AB9B0F8|nr:STAS domain-containing protein [Sphingopyxis sp.]MDZ3832707.1 STAS domain-containing protein [Sphingopyxis sp.]